MTTRIYTNGWFTSVPEPSNSTSVYTQGWFTESDVVPSAPTNLDATATSFTDLLLTWDDASSIEDGFRIYRSPTGSGTFTLIGEVGANVTQFTDPNVVPGVGYDYRVTAFNVNGESDPAELVDETTPFPPAAATTGPPVPVTPVRNKLLPLEVLFISPNVYGVEVKPSSIDIIGYKF